MAKKLAPEERMIRDQLEELDPAEAQALFSSSRRFFVGIEDPRVERTKLYQLADILILTLCAILSGAKSWRAVETYAKRKRKWLAVFINLNNGVPSHDTIGRVFAIISPTEFHDCFTKWVQTLVPQPQGHIAIDGKTVRGSVASNRPPVHLVNVWSEVHQIVLAQVKTEEKSNEITAIPEVLDQLDVTGTVVSIDAMGCQREIARKIISKGGDYLLALKGNQSGMQESAAKVFESNGVLGALTFGEEKQETGHGRGETRRCVVANKVDWMRLQHQWPGLRSIVMVERTRTVRGKQSKEQAFYISSLEASPDRFGELVRGHWGIENKLHWVLDTAFAEDRSRARVKAAADNFSLLRKIALNLLRLSPAKETSIQACLLAAGWDDNFLLRILSKLAMPASV